MKSAYIAISCFALITLSATCVCSPNNTTATSAARATTGTLEPGQSDTVVKTAAGVQLPAMWSRPLVEARSIWIDSNELMGSRDSLTSKLETLKRANFNTVMVDSWFRGYVPYPDSRFAPIYPGITRPDQFAWLIGEIKKRGMRAEIWPSYGFYAYYTRDAKKDKSIGPVLQKHPELAAVDSSGTRNLHNPTLGDYYSLCPANPKSHEFLADLITETVTRFGADGLNLDRMRFPSDKYCYCLYCQTAFQRDTKIKLRPADPGTTEALIFLQWKREQNAKSVETVVNKVRAAQPGLPITAYVVGPDEMDNKAQSWDLWVKRGFVDAVAVSMYGADIRRPAGRALELLDGRSDKLLCAISAGHATPLYLLNIHLSREMKTLGQYTWYSGSVPDDIDALTTGPYAAPAAFPPIADLDTTIPAGQ